MVHEGLFEVLAEAVLDVASRLPIWKGRQGCLIWTLIAAGLTVLLILTV